MIPEKIPIYLVNFFVNAFRKGESTHLIRGNSGGGRGDELSYPVEERHLLCQACILLLILSRM